MPALPVVPNVFRTDLRFIIGEDTHAKVRYYFHYSGTPPTDAEMLTYAGVTRANFDADLKPLMTPDRQLFETTCTDLSSSVGGVGTDTTAVVGTAAGALLPGDTALLSSFEVHRRFRGGHSRAYWPFGSQSALNDAQLWTPTFVTTCQNDLNAYFANLPLGGWAGAGTLTHVAVSFFFGNTVFIGPTGRARNIAKVRVAPVVDDVTAIVVRQAIASQRRRKTTIL